MIAPVTLSLLMTYKCNFYCSHCSVEASPLRDEVMCFNDIKHIIQEAYTIPSIKLIVFTGGEVTLYEDILLEGIDFAHKQGFITRIVTNGWWAKTAASAESMIKKLCDSGLNELNISFDDFHVPELEMCGGINNIRNILLACKTYGLRVILCKLKYNGAKNIEDSILDNIDEEINVKLIQGFLSPLGRARKTIEKKAFIPDCIREECKEIGKTIAILPSGDISHCCGHAIFSGNKEMFIIGNLHKNRLIDVILRIKNNKLLNFLYNVGPEVLLRKLGATEVSYNNCEACYYIANEYREKLLEKFSDDKKFLDIYGDNCGRNNICWVEKLEPLSWLR